MNLDNRMLNIDKKKSKIKKNKIKKLIKKRLFIEIKKQKIKNVFFYNTIHACYFYYSYSLVFLHFPD